MTVELSAVCFDAAAPGRMADFWAGLLDRTTAGDEVIARDGVGFRLRFVSSEEPKTVQNPMHFDLTSSSAAQQRETVERALALGARHIDIGQRPEDRHVVLADPEGNEFCVIEPGNNFLSDCGFLGCLASDGTYEVGLFWHRALAWPLVWDEGEETAVQDPRSRTKISWGGRPFRTKTGKNRVHHDLSVPEAELAVERDRLQSLGASLVGATHDLPGATAMADPDGNEFCLAPQADQSG